MLWVCRCHCCPSVCRQWFANWHILLKFYHKVCWHRIKAGIHLGYCSHICFQTRGTKLSKMFFSLFLSCMFICFWIVLLNEFLRKITFIKMHSVIIFFYIKGWEVINLLLYLFFMWYFTNCSSLLVIDWYNYGRNRNILIPDPYH